VIKNRLGYVGRGLFLTMTALWISLVGVQSANSAESKEVSNPTQLMRDLTDQVMQSLVDKEEFLQENPEEVNDVARYLVNKFVIPHLDMILMSRWIVGKSWKKATPEKRRQFTDQFTEMLIGTYASALLEFRGKSVAFKPFHRDPKRKDGVVKADFYSGDGAPTVPVWFRVRLDKSEQWKVFDIIVDGVSLVKNYRSSFSAEIRKVGFDGLIARLTKHNLDKKNSSSSKN